MYSVEKLRCQISTGCLQRGLPVEHARMSSAPAFPGLSDRRRLVITHMCSARSSHELRHIMHVDLSLPPAHVLTLKLQLYGMSISRKDDAHTFGSVVGLSASIVHAMGYIVLYVRT